MTERVSPFELLKQARINKQKESAGKTTVVATKVTTVFEQDNAGYNVLSSLNHCPICNIAMTQGVITTEDGRVQPMAYCTQHRICLPLLLEQVK